MSATATDPDLVPPGRTSEPAAGRLQRVLRDPGRVWGLVGIPVLVGIVWLILYLWVRGLELDSIEQRVLNAPVLWRAVRQHIALSLNATVWVVLIAIPAGIVLTRPFAKPLTPFFVGLANMGQAIPSVGLIFLLAIVIGTGPRTAIVAVTAYCILPVLRNTMVGIQQVDESLIEAARGMGMTKRAVLFRIELPLAVPVILAGVRTALILVVGTMVLATFINGGGLGEVINSGIVNNRAPVTLTGAVLTAGFALLIDWAAGVAEVVLRPRGL